MEILILIVIAVALCALVGKRSHPTHMKGLQALFSRRCPNCRIPIPGSAKYCAHCTQPTEW
jgi:hypothetical protein